jgi:hypothetical protein
MLENDLTSLQITKKANKRLAEIAEYFLRSKTKQVEWWIEQEHRRIFQDGETSQEETAAIPGLNQP